MINVQKLRKRFIREDKNKRKTAFLAVNQISFEANDGEIVGILGPNGAGKTTLLRMLAGIMEPTSGTVVIDGLNYQKNPLEIKKKLAFLSGNTKLYNRITPHELIQMCGKLYGMEQEKNALDNGILHSCSGNLCLFGNSRTFIYSFFPAFRKYHIALHAQ